LIFKVEISVFKVENLGQDPNSVNILIFKVEISVFKVENLGQDQNCVNILLFKGPDFGLRSTFWFLRSKYRVKIEIST